MVRKTVNSKSVNNKSTNNNRKVSSSASSCNSVSSPLPTPSPLPDSVAVIDVSESESDPIDQAANSLASFTINGSNPLLDYTSNATVLEAFTFVKFVKDEKLRVCCQLCRAAKKIKHSFSTQKRAFTSPLLRHLREQHKKWYKKRHPEEDNQPKLIVTASGVQLVSIEDLPPPPLNAAIALFAACNYRPLHSITARDENNYFRSVLCAAAGSRDIDFPDVRTVQNVQEDLLDTVMATAIKCFFGGLTFVAYADIWS